MGAREADHLEDPRARMLAAIVDLVGEGGARRIGTREIAQTAGVTEAVFRAHFADEEECFLVAFDESVAIAAALVDERTEGKRSWTEQVAAALEACLEAIIAEPARARLCLIAAQTAGDAALARYHAVRERVSRGLRQGRALSDGGDELPEELELFIASGLAWIIQQRLAEQRLDELAEALPEMLQFALAPYVGESEAAAVSGNVLLTRA